MFVPGTEVQAEIERVLAMRPEVLVIGGGDGTVSTAAGLVADTDVTLAILGLGARNHFALDLGLPLDPVEAIALLDRMHLRTFYPSTQRSIVVAQARTAI